MTIPIPSGRAGIAALKKGLLKVVKEEGKSAAERAGGKAVASKASSSASEALKDWRHGEEEKTAGARRIQRLTKAIFKADRGNIDELQQAFEVAVGRQRRRAAGFGNEDEYADLLGRGYHTFADGAEPPLKHKAWHKLVSENKIPEQQLRLASELENHESFPSRFLNEFRSKAMTRLPKTAGVPFLEQDRPEKVKEIYRALVRDHPEMPAAMKARIAARKGRKTKDARRSIKDGGPKAKAPITHKRVGSGPEARYVGTTKKQREQDARYQEKEAEAAGFLIPAAIGALAGGTHGAIKGKKGEKIKSVLKGAVAGAGLGTVGGYGAGAATAVSALGASSHRVGAVLEQLIPAALLAGGVAGGVAGSRAVNKRDDGAYGAAKEASRRCMTLERYVKVLRDAVGTAGDPAPIVEKLASRALATVLLGALVKSAT